MQPADASETSSRLPVVARIAFDCGGKAVPRGVPTESVLPVIIGDAAVSALDTNGWFIAGSVLAAVGGNIIMMSAMATGAFPVAGWLESIASTAAVPPAAVAQGVASSTFTTESLDESAVASVDGRVISRANAGFDAIAQVLPDKCACPNAAGFFFKPWAGPSAAASDLILKVSSMVAADVVYAADIGTAGRGCVSFSAGRPASAKGSHFLPKPSSDTASVATLPVVFGSILSPHPIQHSSPPIMLSPSSFKDFDGSQPWMIGPLPTASSNEHHSSHVKLSVSINRDALGSVLAKPK